jgi:hypothetical protein
MRISILLCACLATMNVAMASRAANEAPPTRRIPAEDLRRLPVDNLAQATSLGAGIVVGGGAIHFCGPGPIAIAGVDAAARRAWGRIGGDTLPEARAAIERARLESDGRPESALWTLVDSFERLDVEGYLGALAEDFAFDSDDPAFSAALPAGMDKAGERSFVSHLFRGGGRGEGGAPLPVAVRVEETLGPMRVIVRDDDGARAGARIEHVRVRLTFADGTSAELAETGNEMELVLGESGWRVRRWHETHGAGETLFAGEPDAGSARLTPALAAAAPPLRLAIAASGEPAANRLRFDLVLPGTGGALELFDLMGRRVTRRDLAGMLPGSHTLSIEAGDIPAGVYWARVRLGGEAVSARVVWIR